MQSTANFAILKPAGSLVIFVVLETIPSGSPIESTQTT